MGQYYVGYVNHNGKEKAFDNRVDNDWQGVKLMEHSYRHNLYVGNVVNDLFYNKGKVCWVGDYYSEEDYSQINCDNKELVKAIGEFAWGTEFKKAVYAKSTRKKVRFLDGCLIVNHTKKQILICDDYYEKNKWFEEWEGKQYPCAVHPLPLLTCSANHSGGSYYGINKDKCGIWFNDTLEIVLDYDLEKYMHKGYVIVEFEFHE